MKKEYKEFLIPDVYSRLGDVAFGPLKSLKWKDEEIWYCDAFLKTPVGYHYTLVFGFKVGAPTWKSKAKHVFVRLPTPQQKIEIEKDLREGFSGRDVQFAG